MRLQARVGLMLLLIGCTTTSTVPASKTSGIVVTGKEVADVAAPLPYQVEYVAQFQAVDADHLAVCTWNVQWIGHWKAKRNADIANVLRNCDVAVIQEMIAPPWSVPIAAKDSRESKTIKGDAESKAFVTAMENAGFDGIELSAEDTGPKRNHINTPASEWYVMFYKSQKVQVASDLPKGFLAKKLAGNSVYSRVPHAFGIRAKRNGQPSVDMVLISVHLHATGDNEPKRRCKARRIREFRFINQWISQKKTKHSSGEKDYFVLGDMNIEDLEEVQAFLGRAPTWLSAELAETAPLDDLDSPEDPSTQTLLSKVRAMNFHVTSNAMQGTNLKRNKPYDHVMHYTTTTLNILPTLQIVDLANTFGLETFASASAFVQAYSDHNPLRFVVTLGEDQD